MNEDNLVVSLQDVSLGYGSQIVLEDVNLTIREGAFLGLVGPNGSGKTTLLRGILGKLKPRCGTITHGGFVRGSPVRFGYVPQHREMDERYPLSAQDVVAMGAYPRQGMFLPPGKRVRQAALDTLQMVGAVELAGRPFRELSGGQKQRVLVARALASGAQTLLLDEPTNDMDLAGQHDLMQVLSELRCSVGLTILTVSHLLHIIFSYVDELAVIHRGRVTCLSPHDSAAATILADIYGRPVDIVSRYGRRAVLVGDRYEA